MGDESVLLEKLRIVQRQQVSLPLIANAHFDVLKMVSGL
jgi:hypothetical protein